MAALCMAGLSLFAGACSSGSENTASSLSTDKASTDRVTNTTDNPYGAGIEVDPPAPNEAVLIVTGPAATKVYSLEQLATLGSQKVTIAEPFVKKTLTFTAFPLEAVLTPSGLTGSQMVTTTALNEYEYSNTAESFVTGKALLAYELNGKPIPYDQGGPIRIIFADDAPGASNLDAWNWSLSSVSAQ